MENKVIYLGAFLTEDSKEYLRKWVPPFHETVHAEHVTIAFRPNDSTLVNFLPLIGETVELHLVGQVCSDKVQAVIVRGVSSQNKIPHITVSTAKGEKPFISNTLLENTLPKDWGNLPGPIGRLMAVYDTFPRGALEGDLERARHFLARRSK